MSGRDVATTLIVLLQVDIWAIGCLYAEMLTGDPIFPGDSDIDQIYHITKCFGEKKCSVCLSVCCLSRSEKNIQLKFFLSHTPSFRLIIQQTQGTDRQKSNI